MKKFFIILLTLLTFFSLTSCIEKGPSIDGNNQSETPGNGESHEEENKEDLVRISYTYTFDSKVLNDKGGSANLGGLTWTYPSSTYLGYDATKGLQVGSSKNPQREYILAADFKETVYITDYSLTLSTASKGNSSYTISFGDYNQSGKIATTDPKEYVVTELEEKTTNIKIKLAAEEKAMYIKNITFSLLVAQDSNLDFEIPNISEDEEVKPGTGSIPNTKYDLITKEKYYEDFNLNLTGDALRNELDEKNDLKTKYNYGDSRYILQYADASLDKDGYVYGIYDGLDIKAKWANGDTWNREHVWACSHMTREGDERPDNSTINHMSDLHNLRASTNEVNSSRNNDYFDITSHGEYYFPNEVAKNNADSRGDVARILFYMYVTYDFLILSDNPALNPNLSMGKLSVLIKWNEEDPVDEFEIRRNNRIYQYQGNRNPFIDYPELVENLFA